MSGHSWSTRENGEDRRLFLTEAPSEGCFYVEIEEDGSRLAAARLFGSNWPAARLSHEAAQQLVDWLLERLAARREEEKQ